MNIVRLLMTAALVATTCLPATAAVGIKGQQYASQAKITLAQARAIALKAVPGKVTDVELEKERGGSGLRYSFDIRAGSKTYEVGVDAKTGAVLEKAIEGKDSD